MITQNKDRNRKTKYGHKREGNTGHGKHSSDITTPSQINGQGGWAN